MVFSTVSQTRLAFAAAAPQGELKTQAGKTSLNDFTGTMPNFPPPTSAPSAATAGLSAATSPNSITATTSAQYIDDGTAPFDSDDNAGDDSSAHNNRVRSFDTILIPVYYHINTAVANPTSLTVRVDGYVAGGYSQGRVVAYFPHFDTSDNTTDTINVDAATGQSSFSQVRTLNNLSGVIYVTVATEMGYQGATFTPHVNLALTGVNGSSVVSAPAVSVSGIPAYTLSCTPDVSFNVFGANANVTPPVSMYQYVAVQLNQLSHGNAESEKGVTFPNSVTFTTHITGDVTMKNSSDPQLTGDPGASSYFSGGTVPDANTSPSNQKSGVPYICSTTRVGTSQTTTLTFTNQAGAFNNSYHFWADPVRDATELNNIDIASYWTYQDPFSLGGIMNPNSLENTVTLYNNFAFAAGTNLNAVTLNYDSADSIPHFKPQPPAGEFQTYVGYSNPNDSPSGQTPFVSSFTPGTELESYDDRDRLFHSAVQNMPLRIASLLPSIAKPASTTYHGGTCYVMKWNPNSFNLTTDDVSATQNAESSGGAGTLKWGVLQSSVTPAYSGQGLFDHGISDYTWYSNYQAAQQDGQVSAIALDRPAAIAAGDVENIGAQLVIHSGSLIGGADTAGNPNMVSSNLYLYPDANRESVISVAESDQPDFTNADEYSGNTLMHQTPYRDYDETYGQFVTIGVVKNTLASYAAPFNGYGSYGWHFSAFSFSRGNGFPVDAPWSDQQINYVPSQPELLHIPGSLVYLDMTHPDQQQKITRTVTLPQGVRYDPSYPPQLDYGNYGSYSPLFTQASTQPSWAHFPKITPPRIYSNTDGTTTLTWTYELSYNDLEKSFIYAGAPNTLPDINFKVRFDDYAWSYTGTPPTVSVTLPDHGQHILVAGDVTNNSPWANNADLSQALKVSLNAGPYVSAIIPQSIGYPHSSFTVKNRPYSTVYPTGNDDMVGLIPISHNGDAAGSNFHGQVQLSKLAVTPGGHTVDVYVSTAAAAESITNPRDVNISDGTWTKYTGDASQLAKVTAVYYHVSGNMPYADHTVSIDTTYSTTNNLPGDIYAANSVVAGYTTDSTPKNVVNTAAPSTYQITAGQFSGLEWHDMNGVVNGQTQGPDGLLNHQDIGVDGTVTPVGVNLFKLNTSTQQWELAEHYDTATGQISTADVLQSAAGNFALDGITAGQYCVGFNRGDAAAVGLRPTKSDVALDGNSTINSDLSNTTATSGSETYYLSSKTFTMPDLTNLGSAPNMIFDNVNAGFIGVDGGYSLSVPNLNFGSHVLPLLASIAVLPNLPKAGATVPDNTVTAKVIPTYANPYNIDVSVAVSPFHLLDSTGQPTSTEGLQESTINFYPQAADQSPTVSLTPGDAAQPLWQNIRLTGSYSEDYNRIVLDVPQPNAQNMVQPGKYQATMTYTLNVAGL
ncbi:hypothetical protein L248_1181 [Schleiferilactobacillus shenzhenensis LY-73]|uniref:Uncharacterized protein n=1 Tax=Schleiferilactobacillus shenzhenensis LY-73 TaxID=1231336 RepID=U4TPD2_9LACO|nr:hypothetical protein L248_1181 [Schleiferilactobacillus shenzhenensis LY-73]